MFTLLGVPARNVAKCNAVFCSSSFVVSHKNQTWVGGGACGLYLDSTKRLFRLLSKAHKIKVPGSGTKRAAAYALAAKVGAHALVLGSGCLQGHFLRVRVGRRFVVLIVDESRTGLVSVSCIYMRIYARHLSFHVKRCFVLRAVT